MLNSFFKISSALLLCGTAFMGFAGCSDESKIVGGPIEPDVAASDIFQDSVAADIDLKNHLIELDSRVDSLQISDLGYLGGTKYYLALDDDPVDPEIDWDSELTEGSAIYFKDTDVVHFVALDDENRTVAVWTVSIPSSSSSSSSDVPESSSVESSSSSTDVILSDDSRDIGSSESSIPYESLSSTGEESSEESSNSESDAESVESSSESAEENGGSEAAMTSSSESSAEQSMSSSDGTEAESSSSAEPESSSSEDAVESSSSESAEAESSSAPYEPQLPASDFSSWDKSFWGSTSDAMATEGTGTYKVVFNVTVTMSSTANAEFDGSKLTLTTQSVTGTSLGIDGGWKMAGGFYFAGSYTGTDAASIYQADNEDAGADSRPADFSQYMKFGQPFTGRPASFDVTYSYEHVDNTNDTYPQSSLIYVVLVSADNKIVAAGKISDDASVDMTTKTVKLEYGDDAGLVASSAIGISGLSLGTGNEEVASIRVMFASSALAYVADGGTSSQMKKNFRGGEGSKLVIDELKLNY